MRKGLVVVVLVVFMFLSYLNIAWAKEHKEFTQDEIVAIATAEVKGKGFKLDEVQIIYDDGNRLWDEQIGKMTELSDSPNFGIFKKGFMNNYRTVYFDFIEPMPDIWVFIDKDTGEVLEVYQMK
ncbi:MAG: hypothetical protein AB1755_02980 [Candidatus Omnitrophota bacterium]